MSHTISVLTSLPEPSSLFIVGGFLIAAALLLRRAFQVAGTGFQPAPKETPQAKEGLVK